MTKDTCIQHFYKKKKTSQDSTIHTRLLQNPWGLSYGKQENTLTLGIPHARLQTWKDSSCKSNSHLQGSGGLSRGPAMSALGRSDRRRVTLTNVLKCAELRRTDTSGEKRGEERGAQFGTRETISPVRV